MWFRVALIAMALIAEPCFAAEFPRVVYGNEVRPLKGASDFCEKEHEYKSSPCKPHVDALAPLGIQELSQLSYVNRLVNSQIVYQVEPDGVDIWQDDPQITSGDCEDYVLVKRRLLIDMGWPAGSLHVVIVEVKESDKELHALLLASTISGDFVLNTHEYEPSDTVRPWDPAEFFKLQMIWGADGKWYGMENSSAVVAQGKP